MYDSSCKNYKSEYYQGEFLMENSTAQMKKVMGAYANTDTTKDTSGGSIMGKGDYSAKSVTNEVKKCSTYNSGFNGTSECKQNYQGAK
jgi:hypothetical protein